MQVGAAQSLHTYQRQSHLLGEDVGGLEQMPRRGGGGAVGSEQLTLGTMALWAPDILGVGFPPSERRSWCRVEETGASQIPGSSWAG